MLLCPGESISWGGRGDVASFRLLNDIMWIHHPLSHTHHLSLCQEEIEVGGLWGKREENNVLESLEQLVSICPEGEVGPTMTGDNAKVCCMHSNEQNEAGTVPSSALGGSRLIFLVQ